MDKQAGYADSVTLLQVSAQARAVSGVRAAQVAMGTDLNLRLLAEMGFAPPPGATANDLVVAVRADGADALAAALAVVRRSLDGRGGGPGGAAAAGQAPGAQRPRTTGAAARMAGPGLALISVPGQHAFVEAMDALDAGCDVMIFSDNVPVEQEIVLKDAAAARGLIVMGPDCGTALVGGVALGFSHALPLGPVGLVAASGSGAQQVMCLLDAAGVGLSAVLGAGGRDLSEPVGARSARAALTALDQDVGTELIIMLSKPPAAAVAAGLREFAGTLRTPVQFALVGPGQPDLTAATGSALRALGVPVPGWARWTASGHGPAAGGGQAASGARAAAGPAAGERGEPATGGRPDWERPGGAPGTGEGADLERPRGGRRALRGLFAGGTLCYEAMVIASERLGVVRSNTPLRPDWLLPPGRALRPDPLAAAPGAGHMLIDFGDDELTAGRPHPMIDQTLRLDGLAAAAADPATAVILLDVVLGYAAHPDPAGELAPAIAAARAASGVPVVASLVGAASDPQGLASQAGALAGAGAEVFASNAEAARHACALMEGHQ